MTTAIAERQAWIEIGDIDDIPRLGSRVVETPEGDIAVFRNRLDEVFALRDACPHRGGPLSQGIVHGREVTCPLHNWCIGLADGRALPPDEGATTRYPVEVRDGAVFLLLVPEE
ncbi:Assimilatory nitrite reductase small subunit, Ferredoxin [Salinisphaera sp. PC39]|uniref:nitrite reductase small subunit NirD n=1 Tax=Salinisphaera sp. PC39 TaxID=1304156 RepID=UPI003340E60F